MVFNMKSYNIPKIKIIIFYLNQSYKIILMIFDIKIDINANISNLFFGVFDLWTFSV